MKKVWPGFLLLFLVSHVGLSQNTQILNQRDLLFNRAMDLYEKEKYNSARSTFAEYLELPSDERSREAEYYQALCGLYLFHPDAVDLLRNIQDEEPEHPKTARINFELGRYYFQQENFSEAALYFRKADHKSLSREERIEAQFKQAYSYFTKQDFESAAPLFNATKGGMHRYAAASYYYSGIIAYKSGDYNRAEKDLEMAGGDDAYKNLIPELLANIYYKKKDYDRLLSIGNEVLENPAIRNRRNIYLILADAFYEREDFQTAFDYFEAFQEGKKSRPEAGISYRMAYSAFKLGKYEYSIPYFDQAAFTGNDSLVQAASYYLGRMHLKNDNLPYAENAFEKAASFDFDKEIQEESFFALAKLKFDSRMRGQSIPLLQKYINDYPSGRYLSEANQYLSEAFLTSNNFGAAIRHIESLGSRNRIIRETYQKVTFYKGVEFFNDRQFDSANAHFDKSLSEPLSEEFVKLAYFWKGESLSILQKFDEAINAYAGVFRNEKDNSSELFLKSRYGIAYAYFNTRAYDKALIHFREYVNALATEKSMYYDDALVRLADCYLVLKKNDFAYNTYLKSLKSSDEERDYTLYRLGVVSWFNGDKNEAQKFLAMVLDEYKDSRYYDDALYEYANIDFENSNFNKAIQGFSRLIDAERISPFLPYAYLNRGISYTNIEKPEKAIEDYRVILNRFASHKTAIDALTGLQEALNSTGRDDEYEKDKAKFAAANPESSALVALDYEGARKQYFTGDYQKAIDKFKNYLNTYGRNQYFGDINYYIAESYYLLSNEDSALRYHKKVLQSTNSNFLNKSILRAGDIQYESGEYLEAIPNYNLLRHLARTRSEEIFAWQGLMLSHYKLQHYDTAMAFAGLITDRGEAAFGARNLALLYLGKSARNLEKFDEAESWFNACIEAGEDVNAAEALFNIAEMRSGLGDYQKSIDLSLDLISRFSHYPEWNDRAFLLIAENFFLMEEYFQSRSTLESIIANSPNEETVAGAKKLLEKVAEKEMIRTEPEMENDTIE